MQNVLKAAVVESASGLPFWPSFKGRIHKIGSFCYSFNLAIFICSVNFLFFDSEIPFLYSFKTIVKLAFLLLRFWLFFNCGCRIVSALATLIRSTFAQPLFFCIKLERERKKKMNEKILLLSEMKGYKKFPPSSNRHKHFTARYIIHTFSTFYTKNKTSLKTVS